MKVLVMTGGIGSGKSFVSSLFGSMGVPVYDADSRVKELYMENSALLESVKSLLGERTVKDGKIDKAYMASVLFREKESLRRLEEVLYPYLIEDFNRWKARHSEKEEILPFVILESAIILEKPMFEGIWDRVATVVAPLEERIERAMKRDGVSRESIEARINNQCSDQERIERSDFVIVSDGLRPLLPQVMKVYNSMI